MKKRKLHTGVSRSVSIYDTRAYRISLYRDGIRGDDTGKGVQFSLGNAYEPFDLRGKRTVPCGQLLCPRSKPLARHFYGIYAEYPPYFFTVCHCSSVSAEWEKRGFT